MKKKSFLEKIAFLKWKNLKLDVFCILFMYVAWDDNIKPRNYVLKGVYWELSFQAKDFWSIAFRYLKKHMVNLKLCHAKDYFKNVSLIRMHITVFL